MTPAGSGQPASERAIRIRSASLAYGSITALDDVTIDIAEGEKIALVGESGAGKTSLLRALVGTAALDSGIAEVLGASVGDLRGRAARLHRRQVALVAQGLDLALPLRVIHNVNAGRLGHWSTLGALWSLIRPAGRAEAGQVLNQVGLGDRLWSRTDELSGGERQRVAIARAMLQAPVVLLADEPTASVDPKLANQLMSLLLGADAPPERTAIVSAHDPVLARAHADRVIGLRAGRVVLDQPADAVTDSELVTFYDHE